MNRILNYFLIIFCSFICYSYLQLWKKQVISHSTTTWIVSINIGANAFPLFFEAESFTDYNLCFILNWHSTPIGFGIV